MDCLLPKHPTLLVRRGRADYSSLQDAKAWTAAKTPESSATPSRFAGTESHILGAFWTGPELNSKCKQQRGKGSGLLGSRSSLDPTSRSLDQDNSQWLEGRKEN